MRRLVLALAAVALTAGATAVRAEQLVADLSKHRVAITTGFTGATVLLFGATGRAGDVVVVVRGPLGRWVVRRKERVAGVWVNRRRMVFRDVPAFYAVASSRPLAEFLPQATAAREAIGLENLHFTAETTAPRGDRAAFRAALLRNKQRLGLYATATGEVTFLGSRLFRTEVHFPDTVPTGTYTVQVFLIRDGQVASAQTTPLVVSKAGVGAEIFEFAHRSSALYGLIAIIIALMAGWGAAAVFRRT